MKAYKFRSLSNFEYITDIIEQKRLYCADWKSLNDPMEGMFSTLNPKFKNELTGEIMHIDRVISEKQKYRICSLSKNFDNYLMWSHYAEGYKGVAIEVELPGMNDYIQKVVLRDLYYYLELGAFPNEEEAAKAVLFSKHKPWSTLPDNNLLIIVKC